MRKSLGITTSMLAVVVLLIFCLSAHGQLVPNLTISGIPVYCFDATGATVFTEILPTLSDLAQSTSPALSEYNIAFSSEDSADRVAKAMKCSVMLAGGKPSAF